MKFRALVIAAMVIASVNAGGHDKLPSGVENSGDVSKAESKQSLLQKNGAELKGRDPTSVKKTNNLKDYDTVKPPNCKILFAKLKRLQKRILQLSDKYNNCRLTLCKIHIKADSPKSGKVNKYFKSHSTTSGTMQKARQKATALKEEYEETWTSFEGAGCLDIFDQLLSPSKIGELKIFLEFQYRYSYYLGLSLSMTLNKTKTQQSADTSTPTSSSTTTSSCSPPLLLSTVVDSLALMSSSIQPLGPGRRGIALGIPSCFGGHEHGSAVGTMILAKDILEPPPTTVAERRLLVFGKPSTELCHFDNNHPVLIFGDWNTDPQRLQRIVHSWGHGLTVMQFSGSQITRLSTVHGRRHSSIDHFVCNAPARALLTSPRVDRQTAVADHFVIRTSIRAEAQGQPPVPRAPTISRHHCLEATDRIATSNYWDVLADANAVADNLSLRLSPPATRSNRRLLSGTTKRAILASNTARQAFIAAATHTNPDPVQCNTLRDEWSRLKAAATQLERVDGRKQWVKHADNLDRAVSDGRTDLVFAAARAMSGNSSRSAAVTPLYNSDGIVQYDPTSILRVMQGHYGSLAADTTGHSLDLQYWHDRQPIQVSPNTPPSETRHSTCLPTPKKASHQLPFARALLRVCGQVFASATIPRAWLCASIVSIDKKDGDPLNPGDKRGIALINVGLKLVCKVLQMRIERFVETNNLLSYEQAGFRKREECVGQVVSLVDIIQRRQNAGLNTHVLFIDIRKAFDTVPVGALLWKLQNMGFPRRTLAFLKALYTSSSARTRAGSADTLHSMQPAATQHIHCPSRGGL
ncbi:hypothetical protein BASA60_009377 [Batrachochytrium salamandrivorans]|nr:hypothetical protein BASA60_009377 [Batrachochytrium salamandrivorans]